MILCPSTQPKLGLRSTSMNFNICPDQLYQLTWISLSQRHPFPLSWPLEGALTRVLTHFRGQGFLSSTHSLLHAKYCYPSLVSYSYCSLCSLTFCHVFLDLQFLDLCILYCCLLPFLCLPAILDSLLLCLINPADGSNSHSVSDQALQ